MLAGGDLRSKYNRLPLDGTDGQTDTIGTEGKRIALYPNALLTAVFALLYYTCRRS